MIHRSFTLWQAAAFATVLLVARAPAQETCIHLGVKGMPADPPLAVTASHDRETLRIHVELKDGWHLYGREVGGGQPVTVRVTGGAFAAAGTLVTPMDRAGLIVGKAELRLPLRRTGEGDALHAVMDFMVCDALQCLPPIELELDTAATGVAAAPVPLRVLLVGVDEGERTQRIATFLREGGCVVAVTTWATATTELCDAHDVVLADSPTFNQVRGKKVNARNFPATRSPIVAVGFLGTQLLEANKVAMACGYI